jgi:uncharacterized protein (DUF1800 family)
MDINTAQALGHFGLGRRGDEPLPADPAEWLCSQLQGPDPAQIIPAPSAAEALKALHEDRENHVPAGQSQSLALFRQQSQAQLANALTTPAPFRERLVWFWTNHFTVSRRRGLIAPLASAFIEEAIRPHVTGRFVDMLLAVMHHPAMLLYLDNTASIGPDSPAGLMRHHGLNENLARECLELHTVSLAAGYTQADVTAFAKVLTGWSVDLTGNTPGGFRYRPGAHEPGQQVVMNRRFPSSEEGGIAALRFLAAYPTTHRFLATKLVRHFVADSPPPDAVRRIESVLRDSGGDLGAAATVLVPLEAAWQPLTKFRTPQEFVVASVRLLDVPSDQTPNLGGIMAGLGQPLWSALQPNGWPDTAAAWVAPEAMMRRIDWANTFAGRIGTRDAIELGQTNLGPLLRPATIVAMRHAASRRDALTLLLTSPEFMRR